MPSDNGNEDDFVLGTSGSREETNDLSAPPAEAFRPSSGIASNLPNSVLERAQVQLEDDLESSASVLAPIDVAATTSNSSPIQDLRPGLEVIVDNNDLPRPSAMYEQVFQKEGTITNEGVELIDDGVGPEDRPGAIALTVSLGEMNAKMDNLVIVLAHLSHSSIQLHLKRTIKTQREILQPYHRAGILF